MDCNFLQYGVVVLVALAAIVAHSGGRDLRPSDHGLAYQEDSFPPAQKGDAEEMRSFFGATTSSSSSSSSSSSVQLPEAKNISDTWWSAREEGRARDVGRDHVRLGLLVASAVCGATGVVLLSVSGVVLIFRLRKRNKEAEGIPSTSAPAFVAHAANEK